MCCHYKAATVETSINRKTFESFCKKHFSPGAYHVVRERDSFLLAPLHVDTSLIPELASKHFLKALKCFKICRVLASYAWGPGFNRQWHKKKREKEEEKAYMIANWINCSGSAILTTDLVHLSNLECAYTPTYSTQRDSRGNRRRNKMFFLLKKETS